MHGTMIVKGMIGDLCDVKVSLLQEFILYEYEGGPIVAVLKLSLHYVGTFTTLEGGEDPTEAFYTGKMLRMWFLTRSRKEYCLQISPF